MRTKEEIIKSLPDLGDTESIFRRAVVELLADIRDQLARNDVVNEVWETADEPEIEPKNKGGKR